MKDMLTDQELQSLRNLGNEAEAAADEIDRLRSALDEARAGFALAYDAAEKGFTNEVLLHCGHHGSKAARALLHNAIYGDSTCRITPTPRTQPVVAQRVCALNMAQNRHLSGLSPGAGGGRRMRNE